MGASRSAAVLGRLPQPSAAAQFHAETGLDAQRAGQSSDTDKPSFERRTEPAGAVPTEFVFGAFRLLARQYLLLEDDEPVPLGSRALQILIILLERPGEVINKQELMSRVWPGVFVEPANLTVHISALRRWLRDGREGNRFIINVPGRGYCFVAPVVVAGPIAPDGDGNRAKESENSTRPPAWWNA